MHERVGWSGHQKVDTTDYIVLIQFYSLRQYYVGDKYPSRRSDSKYLTMILSLRGVNPNSQ